MFDRNNALLFKRIEDDFEYFLEDLEKLPPKEIVDRAYEKVIKEDIVMCFEDLELAPREAKALLNKVHPLDFVYNEWLKNDYSHMDKIRDTIDDSCKIAVRDMKALSRGDR